MACTEITNAINWAKQTGGKKEFPVTAFFTKHGGVLTDPNAPPPGPGRDYCWYAVGRVSVNAAGHLIGDLQLYSNGGSTNITEPIEKKATSTVGVDIFPDGTVVTYQQKLSGQPVGGMPPTKVTTSCLGGVLLTGTNQNEVIAVGVRRDASVDVPA
jgi:hypothetical protein